MTPENLSRAFSILKKDGIGVEGPEITIESADALIDIARFAPLIDNFSGRATE